MSALFFFSFVTILIMNLMLLILENVFCFVDYQKNKNKKKGLPSVSLAGCSNA